MAVSADQLKYSLTEFILFLSFKTLNSFHYKSEGSLIISGCIFFSLQIGGPITGRKGGGACKRKFTTIR